MINNRFNVVYHLLCVVIFWVELKIYIFIYKNKTMSKEMREQINKIKRFGQLMNENRSGDKTIINLIFDENEVSELYKIKEKISIDYLGNLDIDPFSNQDEDELIDFIKNSFSIKGIKIDKYDMENILNLVSNNIRI
jgi:hypothetical protein